jgi:hypothetical protein
MGRVAFDLPDNSTVVESVAGSVPRWDLRPAEMVCCKLDYFSLVFVFSSFVAR